ncbi:MAG: hypothetical protein E7166_06800 [Firmicutes bacterium]|nr:hypothetical protein [Bacillota bacterium]
MNQLLIADENRIENMIYEIRGKQVILDNETSRTKCHCYIYDKIITHYDIGKPISSLIILL